MKVIGKSDNGYILSANSNEVARLVGYYYYGEAGCPKIEIGDDLQVHEMYQQLYELRYMESRLRQTRSLLLEMAKALEVVDPIKASEERVKGGEG